MVKLLAEEKIPQLFPQGTVRASTALALVNAVYLDAPWEFPFDPTAAPSCTPVIYCTAKTNSLGLSPSICFTGNPRNSPARMRRRFRLQPST